jgi:hypothetical protein
MKREAPCSGEFLNATPSATALCGTDEAGGNGAGSRATSHWDCYAGVMNAY